ncbi:MAG: NAD(P)/FAD-dependent oxidoreductase, partial [Gemmatimonadales bacterium]
MTTDRTDAPFIIVGGGMAGDAAARGIRMVEEDHPIVLLTTEGSGPYDRPPLSKDPLASDLAERVDRQTSSEGVDVRTRARVRRIDRKGRRVVLQDGEALEWRGLVLAPGARPVVPAWARVPDGAEDLEVLAFRTLEDARALAGRVEEGCVPLVVGGGFVGTELAAALAKSGHAPALAYPEDAPLGRVLPDPFPRLMARYLEGLGVELQPGTAFRSTETLASSAPEAAPRRGGAPGGV